MSVGVLLDWGADKDARENAGMAPLHLVAIKGEPPCADVLLRAGCNPEARCSVRAPALALTHSPRCHRSGLSCTRLSGAALQCATRVGGLCLGVTEA